MRFTVYSFWGLILMAASAAPAPAPDDILMGPYVNFVTPHSARVVWVTGPEAPAGTVVGESDGARRKVKVKARTSGFNKRDERLHVAVFDGLDHSTLYHYEVRSGEVTQKGTFHTAPPKGARDPFRFIVYGDTRSYPERHLSVSQAMAREKQFSFVVLSGDLVSNGQTWKQWEEQFFTPAREFLTRTAFWPVRGNHEGNGVYYRQLFELPGDELWYSFDYGNLHYVILDSESRGEQREAMVQWLKEDLAANEAEWTFVSYHRPTFNIGGHASDWGKEDVLPVLEEHEVDLVITGHSHLYERFKPIGAEGKKPLIHIVSGGGGAPSYEVRPSPLLEGGIGYSGLHYCYFQIDGNTLRMTVKKPDGEVLDRMKLVKKSGTYQGAVMSEATLTTEARMSTLMMQGLAVDFEEGPVAGEWAWVRMSLRKLPSKAKVKVVGHPQAKGWRVAKDTTERTDEGVRFRVRAPAGLKIDGEKLEPALEVILNLKHRGHTSAVPTGALSLSEATIRRMMPAPEPVNVARAPGPIVIDADASEWNRIKPLPRKDGSPSSVRLAWSVDGLYGLAVLKDSEIVPNLESPWMGDSLHIFVETDAQRSLKSDQSPHAAIYIFSPGTGDGPGEPSLKCWSGGEEKQPILPSRWNKTPDGYIVEFHLSVELLAPARLTKGTVLGFNFAHGDQGDIKEYFQSEWDWKSPFRWGAICLVQDNSPR